MTQREYRSMSGTLALQLATHAAFGLDLAIVGMSLEDAYLRTQIESFREQIQTIIWFTTAPLRDELSEWSHRARIDVVRASSWPDFWNSVTSNLPSPDPGVLSFEWLQMVHYAFHLDGQPITEATNALLEWTKVNPEHMANWRWKAQMHGESPRDGSKSKKDRSKEEDDLARDCLEAAKWLPE
jgi:hypothetical protein